ncbi:MEDS domain-containing protein [Jatrophihabitans fulvus]
MRNSGRLEHGADGPAVLHPHDHVVWTGRGPADFLRLVTFALATLPDDQRLLVVGRLAGLEFETQEHLAEDLASGRMRLADLDGPYGVGTMHQQLAGFEALVDEALADGYAALRVVADNTPFADADDATFERWLDWEQFVDRWQSRREVTGICWFDTSLVPAHRMTRIAALHPLVHGTPLPGMRLFHDHSDDGTVLAVEGDIEAFDADAFALALRRDARTTPPGEPLTVDLGRAGYVHHSALLALQRHTAPGEVRLRGVPGGVQRTLDALPRLDRLRVD